MDSNSKILLADDSAFMRKVVMEMLTEAGYTNFIEAENGKVAIEKIKSELPQLVLLDVIMPEVDGIEVLKQLGKTTKIIVVSAVGQDQMVEEAKANGAIDYITKPFDKADVLEKVNKVLS